MQMVLPASYAVIEEEEMMYLEGGWTTYRGTRGWMNISDMIASALGWAVTASKLIVAAGAVATTGVGVVAAILKIAGAKASIISSAVNVGAVATAITLMARHKGYKAKSWSIFGFGWNMVKKI